MFGARPESHKTFSRREPKASRLVKAANRRDTPACVRFFFGTYSNERHEDDAGLPEDRMRRALLAPGLCAALAAVGPASAGPAEGPGHAVQLAENLDDAPALEPEVWPDLFDERDWKFRLGVVGGIRPDFPGADSTSWRVAPDFSIVWRDRLFVKNETAGVNLITNEELKAGLNVKRAHGRGEHDEGDLAGLGEVDDGVEAGGFLRLDLDPLRLRLQVHHDVASGHGGTLAKLGASTKLNLGGRAWGRVKIETTLASGRYMRAIFGVDARQSADSGLPEYAPGAGFKDVGVELTSGYHFTEHWSLAGLVAYSRLVRGAAASPIVRERGSPNQFVAGLGLFYRF